MENKTCMECNHSRWMVAVGQGFRCVCPENKNKILGQKNVFGPGKRYKMPVIPNRQFCCQHFYVNNSEFVLNKLIFRLQDKIMKGDPLDNEETEDLAAYKNMLQDVMKEKEDEL